MLYRTFGNTNLKLSALGFGTNRFILKNLDDEEGVMNSANLVCKALDNGVNYIDTAYTYSLKKAEQILKIALNNTNREYHITTKVSCFEDKTADGALRRIENSLSNMDINKATFCYMWAIKSYKEYMEIMKKGGIYEGAVIAKKRGLIDHICFSTHASAEDIIKIINDDVFEGMIISYNALNYCNMENVLLSAMKKNIGIITMNSLGGGIIPQNEKYFDPIKMNNNETVSQSALKFIYAHSEITTVLSGMSNLDELTENLKAFNNIDDFAVKRVQHVDINMKQRKGFCTGCNYCVGCPSNIPISKLMQGYNLKYFDDYTPIFNRTNNELLKSIKMFKKIHDSLNALPENSYNPCIKCGICEKKCTQNLPIIDRIAEIHELINQCSFNTEDRRKRLYDLIKSKGYSKVGFYPSGRYTKMIVKLYMELFGTMQFDTYIFDSDSDLWGTINDYGILVLSPEEIEKVKPDCIIVSNYVHSEEIYSSIKHYENVGIKVVKLHNDADIPWSYQ